MADAEDSHPDNKKLEHEGWSDLKEKKRWCTDILFFLILIAVWIAVSIIGLIVTGAIQNSTLTAGNPYRLMNSVDYTNHICGFHDSVKSQPYGYYLPDKRVVCVSDCPSATNYTSFVCEYDKQAVVDANPMRGLIYFQQVSCMFKIKSKVVLNRCVPDVGDVNSLTGGFMKTFKQEGTSNATTLSALTYPSSSSNASYVSLFLQDVLVLMKVIAPIGLGLAAVISFLYLYFLRIPGLLGVIIWGVFLSIQAALILFSILLYNLMIKWGADGMHSKTEVITMQVFAIFGFFCSFLWLCFLIVMRKRVQLAIHIIQEAGRALATMPMLMLMPVIQVTGMVMFLALWIVYIIYLASSGEMETITGKNALGQSYSYREFVYTKNTQYTFVFMLFAWFWTAEFIIAFGQIAIALSFAAWYFTREKSSIGNATVLWAMRTTFLYHMGTAAFGSLIIAIIQTVRAVLTYIQKHAKATKNKVMEYVACCLQCCMWCVEKIMKFINKNAYIQTAIYGYSFCKGARSAFFLILRNILRVGAVNIVGDFVLLLGKILIPLVSTLIAYLIIAYGMPSASINYIVAPLVLVYLLAYFVAGMFTEIYGMGIETILCCYIADEEMFPEGQRFAEGSLQEAVGVFSAAAAQNGSAQSKVVMVSANADTNNQVPPSDMVA